MVGQDFLQNFWRTGRAIPIQVIFKRGSGWSEYGKILGRRQELDQVGELRDHARELGQFWRRTEQ